MQRLINQRDKLSVKFTAKLFLVISIIASIMHAKKPDDLRLTANHPVFHFETWFLPSLFF